MRGAAYLIASHQQEGSEMSLSELLAALDGKLASVGASRETYETTKAEARALINQITQQLQQVEIGRAHV